jgi:2-isopropylmalate synthase
VSDTQLPRRLQVEFSHCVQALMDVTGRELTAQNLYALFLRELRRSDYCLPQATFSSHTMQ